MKKLILLLLVFGTQLSFAQSKKINENKANTAAVVSTQAKNETENKSKLTVEQRATKRTQNLHKKVKLTDGQRAKVKAINLETVKRNDDIRKNKALTKEQKNAELEASNKRGWGYIKAYLTKAQLQKLKDSKYNYSENND